jgi:polar amino acid transport system substrate-binding protein
MKPPALLVTVVIALAAGYLGATLRPASAGATPESAFQRVMRTHTLRCGYGISPPVVLKDPATGQLSGLYVELTNALEPLTGLKVTWPAEVDWGQVGSALDSGKIDAFCAGMWPDSARARGMAFLTPLFYEGVGMIVRNDDPRFPPNPSIPADLPNHPDFTACALEGDVTQAVVRSDLPLAKIYAVPQMSSWGDMLAALQSKKCDFMVAPAMVGLDVRAKGLPARFVTTTPPLRVYGVVPVVGRDQPELKQYLTAVLAEFLSTPTYDRIMKKYEAQYPGTLSRPAPAYLPPR